MRIQLWIAHHKAIFFALTATAVFLFGWALNIAIFRTQIAEACVLATWVIASRGWRRHY